MRALLVAGVFTLASFGVAPTANAEMGSGNYELRIPDRYDFHTWLWNVHRCGDDCRDVSAIARPIARAFAYYGRAQMSDGRWTMSVDVPDGLRCGNVYYGSVIPTHDVYSWDAITLAGTLESSFDAGCDGAPGILTYPIQIVLY